mmetsp:Transcript_45051/g.136587  ORF Transcript_45051/g.136587 Transcript_45051/m.136587 type:complete len:229 (-) Transcript_45051:49-735(-)
MAPPVCPVLRGLGLCWALAEGAAGAARACEGRGGLGGEEATSSCWNPLSGGPPVAKGQSLLQVHSALSELSAAGREEVVRRRASDDEQLQVRAFRGVDPVGRRRRRDQLLLPVEARLREAGQVLERAGLREEGRRRERSVQDAAEHDRRLSRAREQRADGGLGAAKHVHGPPHLHIRVDERLHRVVRGRRPGTSGARFPRAAVEQRLQRQPRHAVPLQSLGGGLHVRW